MAQLPQQNIPPNSLRPTPHSGEAGQPLQAEKKYSAPFPGTPTAPRAFQINGATSSWDPNRQPDIPVAPRKHYTGRLILVSLPHRFLY